MHGNRDQLIQVLLNLVKNAAESIAGMDVPMVKFISPPAFSMACACPPPPNAGEPICPCLSRCAITALGIPDDIRRHLFEPFISTKATGSGLGLALVAKIVADHGGLIDVDSRPGRTEFRSICRYLKNHLRVSIHDDAADHFNRR